LKSKKIAGGRDWKSPTSIKGISRGKLTNLRGDARPRRTGGKLSAQEGTLQEHIRVQGTEGKWYMRCETGQGE